MSGRQAFAYGFLCGAFLLLGMCIGCSSLTASTAQASAWPAAGGAAGALIAGPIGAGVGAAAGAVIGCGGELAEAGKDLEHEQAKSAAPPAPWQFALGYRAFIALIVASVIALIGCNYLPWLPSLLRRRGSAPRIAD